MPFCTRRTFYEWENQSEQRLFHLNFDKGFLTSIHPGASVEGEKQTDYIRPGEVFGAVEITLGGEKQYAFLSEH